jgi:hypothetical protein
VELPWQHGKERKAGCGSVDPAFESGHYFGTEHNGEGPFCHKINEENGNGFFAVFLVGFFDKIFHASIVAGQVAAQKNFSGNTAAGFFV